MKFLQVIHIPVMMFVLLFTSGCSYIVVILCLFWRGSTGDTAGLRYALVSSCSHSAYTTCRESRVLSCYLSGARSHLTQCTGNHTSGLVPEVSNRKASPLSSALVASHCKACALSFSLPESPEFYKIYFVSVCLGLGPHRMVLCTFS